MQMRIGLGKAATWADVEALTQELLELESVRGVSPEAYARRCIEARLAEAHDRRHLAALTASPQRRFRIRFHA